MKKYLIIAGLLITGLLIAGISYAIWDHHVSTTFVPFEPAKLDPDRTYTNSYPLFNGFSENLQLVLQDKGINYQVGDYGKVSIPLKIADNKALVTELTQKAYDIFWVYAHTRNDNSFLCKGKDYTAIVFKDAINLTCDDVKLAEQLLGAGNTEYKLSKYYRQYFGYINDKGERCVEIDLSTIVNSDIRRLLKGRLLIEDGGSGFLHARINLSRHTFLDIVPGSSA